MSSGSVPSEAMGKKLFHSSVASGGLPVIFDVEKHHPELCSHLHMVFLVRVCVYMACSYIDVLN